MVEQIPALSQIQLIKFSTRCDIDALRRPPSTLVRFLRKLLRPARVLGVSLSVSFFICFMIADGYTARIPMNLCALGVFVSAGLALWSHFNIKALSRDFTGRVISLPDSAWHFLNNNAKRIRELEEKTDAIDAQLSAFQESQQALSSLASDEYTAALDQLRRDKASVMVESEEFIEEFERRKTLDADREKCLLEYSKLLDLEAAAYARDNGKYRMTRDLATYTAVITVREKLNEKIEGLHIPPSALPTRLK